MRKPNAVLSLILLLGTLFYSFYSLMPGGEEQPVVSDDAFSVTRALVPLKEISRAPHYFGSKAHETVRQYLIQEMKSLGLEVEEQTGFVLKQSQRLIRPKNIMGRLKGSEDGKALLLLSHYDSAMVPSFGASDAGSGIVTILESLRAYIASGKTPENDIIVLFTDAEEIGLDGASLFVSEHPWAKEVGLVLNFEARGSGGPSNMILETNQGNSKLIDAFIEANPDYPVASSLMYSIYKMLPNDTDSTIFREYGDIDSFFFAFIDDHFDYHTANDTYDNLDRSSLAHQGSYLLPLIHYFADADLSDLKSDSDKVYVNFPFIKMISYSFSWIPWMLVIAVILFLVLVFLGLQSNRYTLGAIGKGFWAFLIPLLICGLIGFAGWKLVLWIYPEYQEIQQGFPYNGHLYIAGFVLLSLTILFRSYKKFKSKEHVAGYFVAPLFFWILINTVVLFMLKGAAYFIIPVYFGLIALILLIRKDSPNILLLTLLCIPAVIFYAPLIQFFPVGLGLKMVVISCVFTVLTFGLLLPVIGFYRWKNTLAVLCFLLAIGFFVTAHFRSDFNENRPKPNSLIYYQDINAGKAYWATYDEILDSWTTSYLGVDPDPAADYIESAAGSKYNLGYTYAAPTTYKEVTGIRLTRAADTMKKPRKRRAFTITPTRNVNRISLFTDVGNTFTSLEFNGIKVPLDSTGNAFGNRTNNTLINYYVTDRDPLHVTFETTQTEPFVFTVVEASYDLLQHPEFDIDQRPANMMPKPFIITDAIITKRHFKINELPVRVSDTLINMAHD